MYYICTTFVYKHITAFATWPKN